MTDNGINRLMESNGPKSVKSKMSLNGILFIIIILGYCYHRVMGSAMVWPKVIPLSGVHCGLIVQRVVLLILVEVTSGI